MRILRTATLSLLLLFPVLTACDEAPDPAELERQEKLEQLRQDLDLPAVPPLETLEFTHRFDDDSYSVVGLLANREEMLEEEVVVTALLREVYRCDRDALTEGERCKQPHMYVSDTLRSPRRLLVVGYDRRYEQLLSEGQRYTFEGRYDTRFRRHLSTRDGLLVAERIEGEQIPPLEEIQEMETLEDSEEDDE